MKVIEDSTGRYVQIVVWDRFDQENDITDEFTFEDGMDISEFIAGFEVLEDDDEEPDGYFEIYEADARGEMIWASWEEAERQEYLYSNTPDIRDIL